MMIKILIGLIFSMSALMAMAQLPPIQTDNGMKYIQGGVGLGESDAIKADSKNWPLELTFSKANGQQSEWVSNVLLVIKDTKGELVLSHQINGPMILIGLNPGKYYIESSYEGQVKNTSLTIKNGVHQNISIQWK